MFEETGKYLLRVVVSALGLSDSSSVQHKILNVDNNKDTEEQIVAAVPD